MSYKKHSANLKRWLIVVLCCVFLLSTTACLGGGSKSTEFKEIILTLGGLPSSYTVYEEVEILAFDKKGNILDVSDNFPPMDCGLTYTYPIMIDKRADTLVINLYSTYNSTRPSYFYALELAQDVTQHSVFYWLNYSEAENHRYVFGFSETMAIPFMLGESYYMDFDYAPYYLFKIAGNSENISEISFNAMEGYVNVMYGERAGRLSSDARNVQNYELVRRHLGFEEAFVCVIPSSYHMTTQARIEFGTKKVIKFNEPVNLIPTNSPDLVLGLTKYNLYLIDPHFGEVTNWYTLPSFGPVRKDNYLFEDDKLYFHHTKDGVLSYFVWDSITGDFEQFNLDFNIDSVKLDLKNNRVFGKLIEADTNYLVEIDLSINKITNKWSLDFFQNEFFVHDELEQIYVYDNFRQMIQRYSLENGDMVFKEEQASNLFRQPFSNDGSVMYFYEPFRLVARDSHNLKRIVGSWDLPNAKYIYINQDDSLLYYTVKDGLETLHVMDMKTHETITSTGLISSIFGYLIVSNFDDTVVLALDNVRQELICYPMTESVKNVQIPFNFSTEYLERILANME